MNFSIFLYHSVQQLAAKQICIISPLDGTRMSQKGHLPVLPHPDWNLIQCYGLPENLGLFVAL